jgi:hypothetical protein
MTPGVADDPAGMPKGFDGVVVTAGSVSFGSALP